VVNMPKKDKMTPPNSGHPPGHWHLPTPDGKGTIRVIVQVVTA
jgi:hypothetical protein